MAQISRIKDTNGNIHDIKVYSDHVYPFLTKTYASTSYYATAANQAKSTFYFMSVKPDAWYKPWKLVLKVRSFCPANAQYDSITYSTITGRTGGISYANFNEVSDYTGHYYITYYPLKKAGFDAGYGHAIGVSLFYATNYTSSTYYRTFEISIYEAQNCTIEVLDAPVLWENWSGNSSTNYGSLSNLNGASRGLQETGDANDVNYYHRTYYSPPWKTKTNLYRYQLLIQQTPDTLLSFNAVNNTTAGTKTLTTQPFNPFGEIYFYNTTSTYAAGAKIGANAVLYDQIQFNLSYSFNTTNTLTAYNHVFIVAEMQSDGSAVLASNPISQSLPSSQDGLIYIDLGYAYSGTNMELTMHHPVYQFKNGQVIQLQPENGNLASQEYVDDAINNLPSPMVFKGTLGTNGTITSLPNASTANTGFTYKVITAGTYASKAADVGDIFISDGTSWDLVPSGDDISSVIVTKVQTSGTKIATITVDSTSTDIYAPTPPSAATANPVMDGTAAVGTSSKYAKEDHVHPTDTSRQATLVSGTNIKTINNTSILGSGNITTPNTTYAAVGTSGNAGLMTTADKLKLDSIAASATRNTFSAITGGPTGNQTPGFGSTFNIYQVGQTTAGAISTTARTVKIPDTDATTAAHGLLTAADKIKLNALTTADATTAAHGYLTAADKIKLNALSTVDNDTTYAVATTAANGLMSSTDKTNLNTVYAHAVTNKGSSAAAGLYKIQTNAEGHVTGTTAVAKADITALGIPGTDTNTTYAAVGTTGNPGLMTSADKVKLDSIAASATRNTFSAITGGPTGNQTPGFGSTFNIYQVGQTTAGAISTTARTVTIPNTAATTAAAGLMSAADKQKLDAIAASATRNTFSSFTGAPTSNQTPSFGGTFNIYQVGQTTAGAITTTARTVTIPNSTATTAAAGLMPKISGSTAQMLNGAGGWVDIPASYWQYNSTNDTIELVFLN